VRYFEHGNGPWRATECGRGISALAGVLLAFEDKVCLCEIVYVTNNRRCTNSLLHFANCNISPKPN
jgi:hypothetical protein